MENLFIVLSLNCYSVTYKSVLWELYMVNNFLELLDEPTFIIAPPDKNVFATKKGYEAVNLIEQYTWL